VACYRDDTKIFANEANAVGALYSYARPHSKLATRLVMMLRASQDYILKAFLSQAVAMNAIDRMMVTFYRAMHFSAFALSWDRMSSVCLSVSLSVRL